MTLATHADRDLSCYPTTRRLAGATGLSERAVCTHLELAEQEGFIRRRLRGEGKSWKNYIYSLCLPSFGAEPLSVPLTPRAEPRSAGSAARSNGAEPDAEGTERSALGAERSDEMALKDVPANNVQVTGSITKNNTHGGEKNPKDLNIDERAARLGIVRNSGEKDSLFRLRVIEVERGNPSKHRA